MMLVSFPYFIMVGIPGVFNTKTLISKNQELDVGSSISTTFRDRYVYIYIYVYVYVYVGAGAGIYPLKI